MPAPDLSPEQPGVDPMGFGGELDLVCLSYLADTTILTVEEYPAANSGVVVREVTTSIAADGPIVALTAARLGLRAGLIANHVGTDHAGRRLVTTLNDRRVQHTIHLKTGTTTPQMTVVADDAGTRMWFAHLDSTPCALEAIDLAPVSRARLAYLDCYRALDTAAAAERSIAAVQTNLDEAHASHAGDLARTLLLQLRPEAAVITLGALGALVLIRDGSHHIRAPVFGDERVHNTHGAGAAFSVGYARALLAGDDPITATRAGCDLGTAHCTTATIREGASLCTPR